jgi:hypothetical protein
MFRVLALLASGPGFPEGDVAQGLELSVELTAQSQIAPAMDGFRARRFWPDREDWQGAMEWLETTWALRNERSPDEPLWELDMRVVRPGDYITLRRPDGGDAVFRIVSVEAAEAPRE